MKTAILFLILLGAAPARAQDAKARACAQAAQLAEAIAKARDRGVSEEAQIEQAQRAPTHAAEEASLDFIRAAYLDRSITPAKAAQLAFDGCMAP